jgi:hypothetical protein
VAAALKDLNGPAAANLWQWLCNRSPDLAANWRAVLEDHRTKAQNANGAAPPNSPRAGTGPDDRAAARPDDDSRAEKGGAMSADPASRIEELQAAFQRVGRWGLPWEAHVRFSGGKVSACEFSPLLGYVTSEGGDWKAKSSALLQLTHRAGKLLFPEATPCERDLEECWIKRVLLNCPELPPAQDSGEVCIPNYAATCVFVLGKLREELATPPEAKDNTVQAVTRPGDRAAASGADTNGWYTVTQAARIATCNSGVISNAVKAGKLKSNGKDGHSRRVDAADLSRWQLERATRPESTESEDAVQKKMDNAAKKPRRSNR